MGFITLSTDCLCLCSKRHSPPPDTHPGEDHQEEQGQERPLEHLDHLEVWLDGAVVHFVSGRPWL